jgi:hypothetical protein
MDSPDPLSYTRDFADRGELVDLAAALKAGELQRIRQGAFVDAAQWSRAKPEEQMRLRVLAYAASTTRPPIVAFASAAVAHQLPLNRGDDGRVHVIDPGPRPASSRGSVVRHHDALHPADVVAAGSLLVTSLARTVFDVIRSERVEVGVAVFDAALRRVAWRGFGAYDESAAEEFREDVRARVVAASGARGVKRARFVTDFADGRAQLPGESVSRLWMHLLGVEQPLLQLAVAVPGGYAHPDFAWPRLRKFGEYDGEGKYTDPALMGGRSVRQVLRDQRDREGAIVAATGWLPVRWGSERTVSKTVFSAFLRSQGLVR